MKYWCLTFCIVVASLFGSVGVGFALPACSETKIDGWHRCMGTVIENGDTFHGIFINNKKNGLGKYTWKNGDTFLGEYADNKKNGVGKYSYANGEIFEGTFLNGIAHGTAVYTYLDGSKFMGKYREGKRNGLGKMIFTDGSLFEGLYFDGVRSGLGVAKFSNGDKYEGHWADNKRMGQGVYTWKNGDIYAGGWEQGKKFGHGSLSYINGSYFFGNFENGLENGWGVSLTENDYMTLCEYAFGNAKECVNPETEKRFIVLESYFGSRSENDRKNIQQKLKNIGFYNANVDGLWGRDSFAAVLKYSFNKFRKIELSEPLFADRVLSSLLIFN
tara:strand:- start:609 stop:1598 length:990 start_codon:yes stop_codon:yes gene_type:complete